MADKKHESSLVSIPTYVSPLYTAQGAEGTEGTTKKSKQLESGDLEPKPIAWLDTLLGGDGFRTPANAKGPLVVLISGPPGAGKSLLAQQICLNRARYSFDQTTGASSSFKPTKAFSSLLLSTESSPAAIMDNIVDLGYVNVFRDEYCLFAEARLSNASGGGGEPSYFVFDDAQCEQGPLSPSGTSLKPVVSIFDGYQHTRQAGTRPGGLSLAASAIHKSLDGILKSMPGAEMSRFVVLDSLNVLGNPDDQRRVLDFIFEKMRDAAHPRHDVLLLVLNSAEDTVPNKWRFMADVIIQLDYAESHGHLSRTIQVAKARFQHQVMGRHLMKIYDAPKDNESASHGGGSTRTEPNTSVSGKVGSMPQPYPTIAESESFNNDDGSGPRPVLREGGIFIFPSLNHILSAQRGDDSLVRVHSPTPAEDSNHKNPDWHLEPFTKLLAKKCKQPESYAGPSARGDDNTAADYVHLGWPCPWMHEMLGGPMPALSCTAIIGPRGNRKVQLASQFLLDGVVAGEKVMIISCSETMETVKRRFRRLCRSARYEEQFKAHGTTAELDEHLFGPDNAHGLAANIKILHQKPGFISPEEFLHRIYYWVGVNGISRVVLNAIDQWDAVFPRISASEAFVPALVDTLRTHKTTSMIIEVADMAGQAGSRGLAALADTVLAMDRREIRWPVVVTSTTSKSLSMFEYSEREVTNAGLAMRPSRGVEADGFMARTPLLCNKAQTATTKTNPNNGDTLDPTRHRNVPTQRQLIMSVERTSRGGAGLGQAVVHVLRPRKSTTNEEEAKGPKMNASHVEMIPIAPELLRAI